MIFRLVCECHVDHISGLDKVQWDSDDVKKMFQATPVNFANESSSSDKPSSGGGSGSSDSNTDEGKGESKSNTGARAGGIVGGCMVVLGVFGGWSFWKKRNKNKNSAAASPSVEAPVQGQQPPPPSSYEPHEQKKELPTHSPAVEVYVPPTELPGNAYRWELHSDVKPNELHGDAAPQAQELPGDGRPPELSA